MNQIKSKTFKFKNKVIKIDLYTNRGLRLPWNIEIYNDKLIKEFIVYLHGIFISIRLSSMKRYVYDEMVAEYESLGYYVGD